MNDILYWLWISLKTKITPLEQYIMISSIGDAKSLYYCNDYSFYGVHSEKIIKELSDKSLAEAENIYKRMSALDGKIISFNDDNYPFQLKSLADPPMIIYLRGLVPKWKDIFCITVVGTRRYSEYGKKATEKIVRELSEYNIVIVSGMARGIDAIAGKIALRENSGTIAVFGNGIDVVYPKDEKKLYQQILEKGTMISEFPPGYPPLKQNFPRRNRIMAALSNGVLVGQAPLKSGSLITASHALSLGRDVFAIPSDIFDNEFEGCNRLICQGAKLVMSATDIIDEYPYISFQKREKDINNKHINRIINYDGLNSLETEIIKLLSKKNMHIDELARQIGISSPELNSAILMLEINGKVQKYNGNIYGIS